MLYPSISCKCITYGRIATLEESVHSFLSQDYPGRKELIIVNDYPLQNIVFDHPDIKIYNLDKTFNTIGEKENFAMSKCSADIICQWDDDDIAMPNHLSNISKFFNQDTDLLHWGNGVLFNNGAIDKLTSLGNSGIVFSRRAWGMVGGYPEENAGYDMTFVLSIKSKSNKIVVANPPDSEVSWFYMWGGRSYHMSGLGTDDSSRPNVIIRHGDYIESLRQQGIIPVGTIHLNPQWRMDYASLLKKHLENNKWNRLENNFQIKKNIPSDINEHLDTLRKYAEECEHITEMGVRWVVSTWAFLSALPKKLISYDIVDCNIEEVFRLSKEVGVHFEFKQANVLLTDIEPTELLFIDTLHTYSQLFKELSYHAQKVKKFIILHDTLTFGYSDEGGNRDSGKNGLLPAIEDFLLTDEGENWSIKEIFKNNNGLTVLERIYGS